MQIIELTDEQQSAVDNCVEAIKSNRIVFTLGGYAGTGKTTAIRAIVGSFAAGHVSVCALAGKAVSVLRSKGIEASTIHSLIYHYDQESEQFIKVPYLPCKAIVVDEASMVSEELYADLVSYCKPIVFVGDPAQLEPIGRDFNLMANPDIQLETIHRQAAENPIIELATAIRNGRDMPRGFQHNDDGEGVEIKGKWAIGEADLEWADKIIVGYNGMRHAINRRVRPLHLSSHIDDDEAILYGEKIICLQNNYSLGVFNGLLMTVDKLRDHIEDEDTSIVDVTTDDGREIKRLPIVASQFGKNLDRESRWRKDAAVCDYGYAITCHKAQGSQWDKVVVVEQIASSWDANRWRYTAATRAAKQLRYFR